MSWVRKDIFNSYNELIEQVRGLLFPLLAPGDEDSDMKTLVGGFLGGWSTRRRNKQSEEEGAMLRQLNDEYEMRFPGVKLSSGSTFNQSSIADADRFAIGCSEMRTQNHK